MMWYNDVVYSASPDRAEWAELADCPYLADSWIQMLKRRLQNEAGQADEGVSDK
ncbi:3-alpha domain-containing protein [Polycladomyces subterraneus]|uniref:YiiM-like triple helical domain-containing protein n=1 Tax=Polycladomyces subterraneus TaxID=1016997 RepID=A0ABT8IQQ8_9BACL|nr:3-alpha domain-containing protein [Polycladomyces subterraneus]MDN4595134.1 hypothetical protein [Polycladomyces subterraneus]